MINGLMMPPSGDPVVPQRIPNSTMSLNILPKTSLDDTANIRDILNALVGGGHVSFNDERVRGNVAGLFGSLGRPMAQKLLTQISLFNQSPDSIRLRPIDKLTRFYDSNFLDDDVNTLVKKVKMFGSGPIAGAYDSPDVTVKEVSKNSIANK